ncbi:MAG: AprI/Inh family metalloprotease inhibitor [Rhizomicrobium sp.]|jgi:hypothetical protein
MTKLSSLLIGATLALSTVALAHAAPAVTGSWKLSVGVNDAPCLLTLTDAGGVSSSSDCDQNLAGVTHWKAIGPSLQLYSPNGELLAMLNARGDSFYGTRTADGRRVELDR